MPSNEIFYQGLANLDVLIEDTSISSPDYFKVLKIPSEMTVGINTFRFAGNAALFAENTPIFVEILDSNGDPVYYEASTDTDSSETIAVISVYITDQTPPGIGTVIICSSARISADGQILDDSKINVRWKYPIYINTAKRNETGRYLFHVQPQTLYTNVTTGTSTSTLQRSSGSAGNSVAKVLNSGSFSNPYVSWSLAVNQPVYVLSFGLTSENSIIVYTSAIARKDSGADNTDCGLAMLMRITAWLPQTGSSDFDTFGTPITGSSDYFLGGVSGSIASGSTVLGTRLILSAAETTNGTIQVSNNVKSIIYLPDYVQGKIIYVRVEYAPFRLPRIASDGSTQNGSQFNFSLRLGPIIGIIGSSPETNIEVAAVTTGLGTYIPPPGGGGIPGPEPIDNAGIGPPVDI